MLHALIIPNQIENTAPSHSFEMILFARDEYNLGEK